MLQGLPAPERDTDSAPFWEGCDQGVLRLPYCEKCETYRWPPGPACPRCGSARTRWVAASGRGTVYSWVVVHAPLAEALIDQVPYAVGLIELEEGVRIVSSIESADLDAIEAGQPVTVRFEELSDGRRLFTFVTTGATG